MDTSSIIRDRKEQIMQRWLARVKEEVPEAREYGNIALQDDLPDLLDDIVASIDSQQDDLNSHESAQHGRIRATFVNYSLSHVIREYRMLMQVILETVDEEGKVSTSDRDKIIFAVTRAIEAAAEVFFQNRQQEGKEAQEAAEQLVEQLQEEGQLRDDFIGTVTHDLRNPLANISSLVELLEKRVGQDKTTLKLLRAISTSYRRADILIQNLLNATIIQSGKELPIDVQPNDMRNIVSATVDTFREYEATDIEVRHPDRPIAGSWDGSAIQRILENLITNAIKYGEGKVTVCYGIDESDTISLRVHNYGNPIPEEEQDKIFSRYYRREGQTQLGWGIGLSLVRGIARAHHGSVSLRSSEKEGTTFTVLLPRHTPVA